MKRRTYITLRVVVAGKTMPKPIVDACGGGRSGDSLSRLSLAH